MRLLTLLSSVAVLLPAAVSAASCYQSLSQNDFPNCTLVDPRYALHWAVKDGVVTFGVTVDTDKAWVGLGLSEAGGMDGANLYVVSPGKDGKLALSQYFSTEEGMPSSVSTVDAVLDSAKSSRGSGSTTAVFKRPLSSCSDDDNPTRANYDSYVIWAIGQSDTFGQHGPNDRGNVALTLYTDAEAEPELPEPKDLTMYESYFPNFTVPGDKSTTYQCSYGIFPKNDTKYHIVEFEFIAKTPLVHHMILYGCTAPPPPNAGSTYECSSMDNACTEFITGWAPGQGRKALPNAAGIPAGSGNGAFYYYSLQVHYENTQLKSGVVDNSGFKLWYTTQLRPNDLGILFTGTVAFNIPGSTDLYTTPGGNCPSACTKKFPGPLTLWENAFHMHTLGRNATTRHIRDGQELQPLGIRKHYDFNHQSTSPILGGNGTRQFLPGDQLITTCSYSSKDRANNTKYGESTSNEMCFNIIAYWPRIPTIDLCIDLGTISSCTTQQGLEATRKAYMDAQVAAGKNLSDPAVAVGLGLALVQNGTAVPGDVGKFTPYVDSCKPSANLTAASGVKSGSLKGVEVGAGVGLFGVLAAVAGLLL